MNNIGLDHIYSNNMYDFKDKFADNLNDNGDNTSIYNHVGHSCEYF